MTVKTNKIHTPNDTAIKRITAEDELHAAFTLAENVFMQFEAPAFTKRGAESFLSFLWGKKLKKCLRTAASQYGAVTAEMSLPA